MINPLQIILISLYLPSLAFSFSNPQRFQTFLTRVIEEKFTGFDSIQVWMSTFQQKMEWDLKFPNVNYILDGNYSIEMRGHLEGHHRRHSGNSNLILIFIETFPNTSDILNTMLNQPICPLSKKDSDKYFIFLLAPVQKIPFFDRIKFKLFFDLPGNLIYSKCYFCSVKRTQMNLDLNKLYEIQELFPDFLSKGNWGHFKISSPVSIHLSIEIRKISNSKWDTKRGHHKFLLDELCVLLNLTYDLFPSSGGGSGILLPNSSWTGAVSDLLAGRADLALATGTILSRDRVIGFLRPFTYVAFIFTIGLPQSKVSPNSIIWPFTLNVWLLLFCSLLILILLFFLFRVKKFGNPLKSLHLSTWIVYGIFMEQDVSYNKSNRFLLLLLMFFALIMTTAYRSKLLTFLAFPLPESTPETFEELVNWPGFKWGLEAAGIGGAVYQNLKSSSNPTYKKLVDGMSFASDSVNCFLRGLKEKYACLAYDMQTKFLFYKNFSTISRRDLFTISKEATFSPHASGWSIEKRAPFSPNLNRILGILWDNGIVAHWIQLDLEIVRAERIDWEIKSGTPSLFPELGDEEIALSLSNLKGSFVLYLLTISISIVIALGEVFYTKIYKNQDRQALLEMK